MLLFLSARITKFKPLFVVMLLYSLLYGATVPLANSLMFSHLTDATRQSPGIFIWAPLAWSLIGAVLTGWRNLRKGEGDVHCIRLPPRSPSLTPHIERLMRTIKDECSHRMILFGEQSLRKAVSEFLTHYHGERNHQGLANHILVHGEEAGQMRSGIRCRQRLGGMLWYYHRNAA